MILKILVGIISIVFSFGLTLMIKPHIGVYVKSEIILNILQFLFTIVGFGVIYGVIKKKNIEKIIKNRNSWLNKNYNRLLILYTESKPKLNYAEFSKLYNDSLNWNWKKLRDKSRTEFTQTLENQKNGIKSNNYKSE